jgi:hypothetical protein
MTGKKYPLRWVQGFQSGHCRLRGAGPDVPAWHVLLDASAYVGTAPLDLSDTPADFVCLSFYKMFGFPTGLGALLVRKPALALLQKTYFGGGSVTAYRSREPFHVFAANDVATFEDGTQPFQQILALEVSIYAWRYNCFCSFLTARIFFFYFRRDSLYWQSAVCPRLPATHLLWPSTRQQSWPN